MNERMKERRNEGMDGRMDEGMQDWMIQCRNQRVNIYINDIIADFENESMATRWMRSRIHDNMQDRSVTTFEDMDGCMKQQPCSNKADLH